VKGLVFEMEDSHWLHCGAVRTVI